MEHQRDELIRIGALELRFFVTGADTQGGLEMFELTVPPGAQVPMPHYHREVDEAVYVVEGVMAYTVDGRRSELGPGERSFCPRGGVHHFANAGKERTRAVLALTPASITPRFFREVADLVNAGGPPDLAKIGAIMQRHGLVPAPMPDRPPSSTRAVAQS
jgi:quercetin dioxygenase-like cupin family protein